MKRILILLMGTLFILQPAFAKKKHRLFPPGCRQVGFEFKDQKLIMSKVPDGQEETLYLVHNKSNHDIIVETNVGSRYLPTYKKTIPYDHWAIFARIDHQIEFICRTGSPDGYGYDIDCQQAVQLCNYNKAKFPPQNIGTYWLQKTKTYQRAMMRIAIKKGILLRW